MKKKPINCNKCGHLHEAWEAGIEIHYCHKCKAYYCEGCLKIIEGNDIYSNMIKVFLRCPKQDQDKEKHHINATWKRVD